LAEKQLRLSIVTPENVSWEGDIDSLIVPAADGQLGVLPGHAPLLAQLLAGVLQMRTGEETKVLAVSGGFIEVFHERVSVFAETAELASEINEERARQAAERAKAALHGTSPEPVDEAQIEAALRRALVRMKVAELARRRSSVSREKPARP
jgi:F-type H+-transporting ATPase subunit epsilon